MFVADLQLYFLIGSPAQPGADRQISSPGAAAGLQAGVQGQNPLTPQQRPASRQDAQKLRLRRLCDLEAGTGALMCFFRQSLSALQHRAIGRQQLELRRLQSRPDLGIKAEIRIERHPACNGSRHFLHQLPRQLRQPPIRPTGMVQQSLPETLQGCFEVLRRDQRGNQLGFGFEARAQLGGAHQQLQRRDRLRALLQQQAPQNRGQRRLLLRHRAPGAISQAQRRRKIAPLRQAPDAAQARLQIVFRDQLLGNRRLWRCGSHAEMRAEA
ncbi:hypothetical protein [Solimonas aquatica]|uniref:hypothetical protein n=1 Tax=Solimonas aquatica TaxID=489703 RepID=UPI0015A4FA4A|nr:hypothetical protein [Solimonas aquatica]